MSLFLSKKTRMRIRGVMVNVFAMVKSRFGARRRSKTPERSSTAERTTVPIHTPTQEVARMHRKAVFQPPFNNVSRNKR